MKPTEKQKKIILIVVGVFAASYLFRYLVNFAAQMAYYQQQAAQQAQEEKNKKPGGRGGRGGTSGLSPENPDASVDLASFALLAGVWSGRAEIKGRGFCDLRFEMKEINPGEFSGFSRFSCVDLAGLMTDKHPSVITEVTKDTNPDSAILTGMVDKGSIRFRTNKAIGTDISGCAVTAFTITPFGKDAVASEWQEGGGTCQGGNMLLAKERS